MSVASVLVLWLRGASLRLVPQRHHSTLGVDVALRRLVSMRTLGPMVGESEIFLM